MAAITIEGFMLNAVDNPEDRLEVLNAGEFARAVEAPGEVIEGAGGRVRLRRRAGTRRQWNMTFPMLPPEAVAWVEAHAGELVCVRHRRGHKQFGSYTVVDITEVPTYVDELADVSVTFTELTYSEEV